MQEHRHPQIAGAEVDGGQHHAQRSRKYTLHQHAKGCRAEQVAQVRRAKQHAGHKAGLPHPGAGGAVALQQGLSNDAPEHQLLSHAHKDHVQHKGQDAGQRQQRRVRAVKGQRPNGRIPDEEQRVHAHQHSVQKAAAAPVQQLKSAGAGQQQKRHRQPHSLLHRTQQIAIHGVKIRACRCQPDGSQQAEQDHAAKEQHLRQDTIKNGVRSAQPFEHKYSPPYQ